MSAPGYRKLVDPAHPLIGNLSGEGGRLEKRGALDAAVARVRHHFTYRPSRGAVGFDKLLDARTKGPEAPSFANCLDMSAVLVSCLRRAGFSPSEAFIVVCDRLWLGGRARADFHACVLVLLEGAMIWLDPEDLHIVETTGAALLERYKVHVVFNDCYVHVTRVEQQRILSRNMPHSGLQCFLFGQAEPATQAVLDDAAFRAAIAGFFRDGRFDVPDPSLAERAIAAGLLSRREDGGVDAGQRLVTTSAEAERELHAAVAVHVDRYLGITAETLPQLRRAYEACSAAAQFPWSDVCHSIVAGMFLDLAIGAEIHIREEVSDKHGSHVVWAFENITAQNGFGVRWLALPRSQFGVVQMWHVRVNRPALRLDSAMVSFLASHALGQPVALGGPHGVYLRFAKLLRGNTITIPVFLPDDAERLLEPLLSGAARIVREATMPALQSMSGMSAWKAVGEDENHRHAAVRLLLEYAIDRVIDAGLLEPFPNGNVAAPAPSWGTFLWIEPAGRPMRLVRDASLEA